MSGGRGQANGQCVENPQAGGACPFARPHGGEGHGHLKSPPAPHISLSESGAPAFLLSAPPACAFSLRTFCDWREAKSSCDWPMVKLESRNANRPDALESGAQG